MEFEAILGCFLKYLVLQNLISESEACEVSVYFGDSGDVKVDDAA